jgi:hypothetical protein
MEATVSQLFQSFLFGTNEQRATANQQLRDIVLNPEVLPFFVQLLITREHPTHIRQLAGVVLEDGIKRAWDRINPTVQGQIRSALVPALVDNSSMVRSAVAVAVSRIAQHDFPERWPELPTLLSQMLFSGDLTAMAGSLRALHLFSDYLSDKEAPGAIQGLGPMLFRIYSERSAPVAMRARAALVFRKLLEVLSMMDREYGRETKVLLKCVVVVCSLCVFMVLTSSSQANPASVAAGGIEQPGTARHRRQLLGAAGLAAPVHPDGRALSEQDARLCA